MRILLRDTQTRLFVGDWPEGRLPLRVTDRKEAHDFRHVPIALERSAELAGRARLEIVLDFGDPEYDLTFMLEAAGHHLGGPLKNSDKF